RPSACIPVKESDSCISGNAFQARGCQLAAGHQGTPYRQPAHLQICSAVQSCSTIAAWLPDYETPARSLIGGGLSSITLRRVW
ncbi:hypothetical protein, partial [Bartonella sp. AC66GZZY]|uniref:hypothetical protein n=1 Tax=Bartonella sp. AC66GZZY TaxID=3243458 RepID=UPI0035D09F37